MRELKAYIREARLESTIRALQQADAKSVSAVRVVAHYQEMVEVELVCPDEQAFGYAGIVREHVATGDRGDGVIFVSTVEEAIHIRTGERGESVVR